MKVFSADDDPVSRHMLQVMLTKWGHEVVVGRDGEEAWVALNGKDAPRLVVLNWVMPKIDVLEICRMLRKGVRRDPIYIILLTANTSKEDIVQGLTAGADDYISKPFDS